MDLEQLITNYELPESAKQLVRETKIAFLVGMAGAGKGTIKQQLLKEPEYCDIVSHTTRQPRVNNGIPEKQDADYHFIDQATAQIMLENKQFIEAKFYAGNVYGTSIAELQAAHDQSKIALTDIEVQGVDEYKKISSSVIAIFIIPPNYDIWFGRLKSRYETLDEFEAEWPKRRDTAVKELEYVLDSSYYKFLINDNLQDTVRLADDIIHGLAKDQSDAARKLARSLLDKLKSNI